jgi:transcriptional regulator with XRE-family HTH domain
MWQAMQPTVIHKGKTPVRRHYIVEWAEHFHLRKADVAREVGADKGLVGRWWKGTMPGPDYQEKLAALFHTEPEALFRHPDEDWIAKFFKDKSEGDFRRARELLDLAFPKSGSGKR